MKNIVVIEEDGDSLALIKEILEDQGYNVFGAATISHATEIMRRGIQIALFCVSTTKNENAWKETIAQLKSDHLTAQIPIVTIASSARTIEAAQAKEQGSAACVTKPLNEEEVLATIATVLGKQGEGNG